MISLAALVDQVQVWLLILARIIGWVMTVPVFSSRAVPAPVQMGLAGVVALLVAQAVIPAQGAAVAGLALSAYLFEVVKQWLIGAAIGFIASVLFTAAEMAGQLIDIQMGFSMVTLFNPQFGTNGSILANWQMWLTSVVFLGIDGHLAMLSALLHSFEWIHLGAGIPVGPVAEVVARSVAVLFILGVQLAAPLLLTLLLIDVILAFVSRAAPQTNLLFVALPGKILAGWGVALGTLPVLILGIERVMGWMNQAVDGVLRALGTG
ncbi:flagellar biosynthetic protein FliR [Kyrpidia tusciae]|uniref:Flagellar biosynthetic protein FliR n=1 Tax=Kyrpidia tusciae (strain DSM 2912 / NBRC 15312 / T2) TaxID=562970 RepID=D5WPG5_KYRT2|nr:flagellar biosynthetic protein FliR [Kyrpidia tusciae]ADG06224.1 flagellar biosynthetic protein FliR [Kyrpidia tusciae DSM 2912]